MRPQGLPQIGVVASVWFAVAALRGPLAILLGPWAASAATPAEQRVAEALGPLPASFVGDLPCADCPGIRHQLDLYPDQTFVLRMIYLGREPDSVFDDIGSFLLASDGRSWC